MLFRSHSHERLQHVCITAPTTTMRNLKGKSIHLAEQLTLCSRDSKIVESYHCFSIVALDYLASNAMIRSNCGQYSMSATADLSAERCSVGETSTCFGCHHAIPNLSSDPEWKTGWQCRPVSKPLLYLHPLF